MKASNERITFRLIQMERCCNVLLCWVNPRFPNYCPECGKHCYPEVKGWVLETDNTASLRVKHFMNENEKGD